MQRISTVVLVLTSLAFLAPSSRAQAAPLRVCIAHEQARAFPNVRTADLADALSRQKLRSGRGIQGITFPPISRKQLSARIKANNCDYLVLLESSNVVAPSGFDIPNAGDYAQMGAPISGAQFPTDAVSGPNSDHTAQYELFQGGQERSVSHGKIIFHRGELPHRAYRPDYPGFAEQIASKLKDTLATATTGR